MLQDKSKLKASRLNRTEEARQTRVSTLRQKTGKKLSALSVSHVNSENLAGNIENLIGSLTLPVGLAGPLRVNFSKGNVFEEIYGAFATTEGALVSSISRGALAINLSGGITTRVLQNSVSRAPCFLFSSIDSAIDFSEWISSQFEALKSKTKDHSRFAELVKLESKVVQHEVHVIFSFSTGEAAGQNMATFVTHGLTQWVRQQYLNEKKTWIDQVLIEGNLSTDKKATMSSLSNGRGRKVIAEAQISDSVIKKIFKVSTEELSRHFNRMKSARIHAGYMGFNINVSNVVAAMFLTTGQDIACVHESSVAELHMEMSGQGLFVSLYMPSLIVGTVGGGTHLPHAKSIIEMMSCEGRGGADRLAQIICAYALALELSTVSAIEGGQFVHAHENLGRTQRRNFHIEDIGVRFLNENLSKTEGFIFLSVDKINAVSFDDAMMMDLAAISARRLCGIFEIEATIQDKLSSKVQKREFILKIKTSDDDVIHSTKQMLLSLGAYGVVEKKSFITQHPFLNSQKNEVEINKIIIEKKLSVAPQVYFSIIHDEVGFILQEKIAVSEKKFQSWSENEVLEVLKKSYSFHIINSVESLPSKLTSDNYLEGKDLWNDIAYFVESLPYIEDDVTRVKYERLLRHCLEEFDRVFLNYDSYPKRLCHYDFNPRNILLSKMTGLKVIDWEFSVLGLPQRDLVEFLIFTMKELPRDKIKQIISEYAEQIKYPKEFWKKGLVAAFIDFVLRRLNLYILTAEFKKIHFLENVLRNTVRFYEEIILDEEYLRE